MRISVFSAISSLLLLLLTGAFAFALYVCAEQLHQNEQSAQVYQQQKEAINVGLYRTIQAYLQQGDASLLTEAEEQIGAIQASLARFDGEMVIATSDALATLSQNLAGKYRASGKLAGNSQQLLQNAESDLAYYSKKLAQLALEADDRTLARPWLDSLSETPLMMFELARARQNYFSHPDETHWQQLNFQLNQWQQLLERLLQLPLPQPAADKAEDEAEVNFLLMDSEPDNPMQDALDELASQVRRYPKEIHNTRELLQSNLQMRAALTDEVAALEHSLVAIDQQLLQRADTTRQQVQALLLIMVALLVSYAFISFLFQQRIVVARLRRLQRAFTDLLHSGDIKPLEMADGRSELGQIASAFNQLLSQLQEEHQQKQHQMKQVQLSLTRMIEQVQQLTEGSHQTHQQIDSSTGLIDDLHQLATEVNDSSHTIVQHAQNGEQHLSANQQSVLSVREATRMTQNRVSESLSSLTALSRSVGDVSAIIDVISHISEQTNLLALNAAIEAARAGDHGRGFAVVADEVRTLSTNTQKSLDEIVTILDSLRGASRQLQDAIEGIEQAAQEQQTKADMMLQTSEQVRTETQHSAVVAQQGAGNAEVQVQRLASFRQLMQQITEQAADSQQLSRRLAEQIQTEADSIRQAFADA